MILFGNGDSKYYETRQILFQHSMPRYILQRLSATVPMAISSLISMTIKKHPQQTLCTPIPHWIIPRQPRIRPRCIDITQFVCWTGLPKHANQSWIHFQTPNRSLLTSNHDFNVDGSSHLFHTVLVQ